MIRMLIIGYVFAIRAERQICREVQVNLAYRWFCGLGLEDNIPDHSAFSRARNERFRESDVFRHVFERVLLHASRRASLVAKASQWMRASSRPTPTASAQSQDRNGATNAIPRRR